MKRTANWSALPDLAVAAIADRLPFPVDYIRFRSVCYSWRSAAPSRIHFPWLVRRRPSDATPLPPVFSFSTLSAPGPTLRPLPFPPSAPGFHCCGSSYGWLALLQHTLDVSLFNPVTGAYIHLPPFTRFADYLGFEFTNSSEDGFVYTDRKSGGTVLLGFREWLFVSKVVLSSDPGETHDFVALAIHCKDCEDYFDLEFCRLGDDAWTPIEHPPLRGLTADVLFYQGQFYASSEYTLLACFPGESEAEDVEILVTDTDLFEIDGTYLVEVGGDLFLVHLYLSHFHEEERYIDKVYKVDLKADQPELLEMKSVGDYALFLGRNQSFSLQVSKFPGLKGNHIYLQEYSETQIRMIDVEDCNNDNFANCSNDFLPEEFGEPESNWMPCAWIVPSLLQ